MNNLDPKEVLSKTLSKKLTLPISALRINIRIQNMLENQGIITVNDLLHTDKNTLLNIANFGERCLSEIYAALSEIGFRKGEAVIDRYDTQR